MEWQKIHSSSPVINKVCVCETRLGTLVIAELIYQSSCPLMWHVHGFLKLENFHYISKWKYVEVEEEIPTPSIKDISIKSSNNFLFVEDGSAVDIDKIVAMTLVGGDDEFNINIYDTNKHYTGYFDKDQSRALCVATILAISDKLD